MLSLLTKVLGITFEFHQIWTCPDLLSENSEIYCAAVCVTN